MTPYTVAEGLITPEQLRIFRQIRTVLEQAPDMKWGGDCPVKLRIVHLL
jgi:hypothetical protein